MAFDQCKLDYLDCLPNQDIIQFNGGYQNSAWRLANSAYAYALKNMPSTGNVDVFHSLVAARYNEFRAAGYISMADYLRVSALLSSHCLGPSNLCLAGYHKLPNSSLPSFVTEKHPNFVEAESGFAFGTATKPYGSASGGQYVSFGADGDLYIPVNIATPGTYRVHLVATIPPDGGLDEIRIYDPGIDIHKNVGPLAPFVPGWVWRNGSDPNDRVTFAFVGLQYLYLSTAPSHMSGFTLDAVWLEKI